MNKVRTAIIGLGYWGPILLRNFAAQSQCDVIYACDLEEQNIEEVRCHYPFLTFTQQCDEIFRDASIDLVLIATPTSTHFSLAKAVMESGKHVFIEKPMTSTSEEAQQLIAIANNVGRQIFVDHTFVFAPAVQQIADLVQKGKLGDLLYFDSVRINLGLIQRDVNVLSDLAIHDLSILSSFVNLDDITTVAAHGRKYFGEQEEVAHLHLSFNSGFEAHIHVNWLSPVKIRNTILAGTQAIVTYDDTEPSEKLRIYDKGVENDGSLTDPFFPKYRSGDVLIPALLNAETLALEAQHVLRCIQGKEKPIVSGMEGKKVVHILEIANRSLENNMSLPCSLNE